MRSTDKKLNSARKKLIEYISQSKERANEDKIIQYFRSLYPKFSRQQDAQRSDGYVSGHFVLELKGKKNDWLSGFFQGLSYKKELDFSLIVVASRGFLAIWDYKKIKKAIFSETLKLRESKPPNAVGKELARKYKNQKESILEKAIFRLENDSLKKEFLNNEIERFEETLKEEKIVRLKVTINNFCDVLKQMKSFFKGHKKAIRAFYSMLFSWDKNSYIAISKRNPDQATLEGEVIEGLISGKRLEFKNFVENRYIHLDEGQNKDDFFAKYDTALDSVDPDFRRKHGIFFTDLDLSKFAMWFVKKNLGDIGRNYLVIDPACGSGNLITNWRSPLELRHKVVSEIEPELLYTVERRMKGDTWHNGKFTVVPKVSENKGLNFLDKSAEDYLRILKNHLKDKGHAPDKPIAFLCNPPYRGSDDQSTSNVKYNIHETILDIAGKHGSSERYCSFLAQMRLICKIAKDNGLPENSILLLFTKTAWLTQRDSFREIRREMLSVFEDVNGFIVNGKEFFDVRGKFPIAFTLWKYKGENARLNSNRGIELLDLTSLNKSDLSSINWKSSSELNKSCENFMNNSFIFELGFKPKEMISWLSQKRKDFIRQKRTDEQGKSIVGGLPENDRRRQNRSAYGELQGENIGFMDDLTPCRINQNKHHNKPWFRLDKQFMDVKRNRCFSGPADQKSFSAFDFESARKTFFWFGLAKTFVHCEYPMYVDNENLWPIDEKKIKGEVLKICFSIGFAENDCIEATFPANNPVRGTPEIKINNPMTPLYNGSFWCEYMNTYFNEHPKDIYDELVQAVNNLFQEWEKEFDNNPEIHVNYEKSYFIGPNKILTRQAGIKQIKDYADHHNKAHLKRIYTRIQEHLKSVKEKFYEMLMDKNGLDYFGNARNQVAEQLPSKEVPIKERKKQKERIQKIRKTTEKDQED